MKNMTGDKFFKYTKGLLRAFLIVIISLLIILVILSFFFTATESEILYGKLIPENGIDIKAPFYGIISAVLVKNGEFIEKETVIFKFDEYDIKSGNITENKNIDIIAEEDGYIYGIGDERNKFLAKKEKLCTLYHNFDEWRIDVDIPETQLFQLKPEMKVKFYITAVPYIEHRIFSGELHSISKFPEQYTDSELAIFKGNIKIKDDNFNKYVEEGIIRPGMTVRVKVVIKEDYIFNILKQKFFKRLNI